MNPAPVLWLCGPPCVGKSVVAWEIFTEVVRSGIAAAYVDLAQLGFRGPAADDDPGNHRLKARNLGALWPTFRAAGARRLVVSGQVADRDAVRAYTGALPGTALTLCRLRAGRDQLTERVLLRGQGGGPPIPGDALNGRSADYLREFAEEANREAEELERAGIGDLCVDTDGLSVGEVAHSVRVKADGWSFETG
ncbi:hypothetical protein [Amycolatopsis anabasis]|uniref:hypothetical protein n=1 Tax=Amycolatopsis anabasis TaxID=1840409 RepID=UPI00131DBA69|nr:hypothetical protein [Amycolatopsis anabasis]